MNEQTPKVGDVRQAEGLLRTVTLTKGDLTFLREAVAAWIEAHGDPEGELTALRETLARAGA